MRWLALVAAAFLVACASDRTGVQSTAASRNPCDNFGSPQYIFLWAGSCIDGKRTGVGVSILYSANSILVSPQSPNSLGRPLGVPRLFCLSWTCDVNQRKVGETTSKLLFQALTYARLAPLSPEERRNVVRYHLRPTSPELVAFLEGSFSPANSNDSQEAIPIQKMPTLPEAIRFLTRYCAANELTAVETCRQTARDCDAGIREQSRKFHECRQQCSAENRTRSRGEPSNLVNCWKGCNIGYSEVAGVPALSRTLQYLTVADHHCTDVGG
jgi:hypothetical protein